MLDWTGLNATGRQPTRARNRSGSMYTYALSKVPEQLVTMRKDVSARRRTDVVGAAASRPHVHCEWVPGRRCSSSWGPAVPEHLGMHPLERHPAHAPFTTVSHHPISSPHSSRQAILPRPARPPLPSPCLCRGLQAIEPRAAIPCLMLAYSVRPHLHTTTATNDTCTNTAMSRAAPWRPFSPDLR